MTFSLRALATTIAVTGSLAGLGSGCRVRDDSASAVKGVATQPGQLRGYALLNNNFRARFLADDDPGAATFQLSYLVGDPDPVRSGLAVALSAYDGVSASTTVMLNGTPTGAGALLWRLILTDAAKRIAQAGCGGGTLDVHDKIPTAKPVALNPLLLEALRPVCAWPDAGAKTPQALMMLWLAVMAHDAPQAEMQAWAAKFQDASSPFAGDDAATTIEVMLGSMVLNPYFLLSD